jgi:hypothetical protein
VNATADHDRWWRSLPAQGSDRDFGALHLRISATGTVARDACVATIVSHCYVHIHLSPSSVAPCSADVEQSHDLPVAGERLGKSSL